MRLTLRTMLAYLDEILEPDDAEEIGKKISESEQATNIMHYLRECMRRGRVKAPPLYGRGLASDANSVAEYLDNTLADERVAEFEKICLDSESHLAEVASCHQVLTLVLGEPAEIDPAARERMYQLPAHVEEAEAATAASPDTGPSDAAQTSRQAVPPPPRRRPRPEVPEYLRSSRSSLWPVAAIAAAVALLTAGGLLYFGRIDVTQLVGLRNAHQEPATPTDQGPNGKLAPIVPPVEPDEKRTIEEDTAAAPDETATRVGPPAPAPAAPSDDGGGTAEAPDAQAPASPETDDTLPKAPEPTVEPGVALLDKSVAPGTAASQDSGEVPAPVEADKTAASAPGPRDVAINDVPPVKGNPLRPADDAGIADEPVESEGEEVGRSASPDQLLLAYDVDAKQWRRLPARATLRGGVHLRSLPTFRPLITLGAGITIAPHDASSFVIENPDSNGVPGISIDYGRLQIMTAGKAGHQIRVRFGDRAAVITLKDADSIVGLDVRRVLEPGADPSETEAAWAADEYAIAGGVGWEEEGVVVEMQAPQRRTLTEIAASEGDTEKFPDEEISSSDRRAQAALKEKLAVDRSLSLSLKEIYSASRPKRIEEQSLALRCASSIDDFEIGVQALGSPDLWLTWPADIRVLQAALARGPETANKVRAEFEKQHSQADAPALYRMLWGYSRSQLKNGEAEQLTNDALRENVSFRVLCSWNLQEILGLRMQSIVYHPSTRSPAAATNAAADRQWRKTIDSWRNRLREEKLLSGSTGNGTRATQSGSR